MKHTGPIVVYRERDHSALQWVGDSQNYKQARERSLKQAAEDHAAMISTIKVTHIDTLVHTRGFRVDPAQFEPIMTWTADDPIPRPLGDRS